MSGQVLQEQNENKVNLSVFPKLTWSNMLIMLLMTLVSICIMIYILQYSWNTSMTKLFNLPRLDFSTAISLVIVVSILFGNLRLV